MSATALGSAPSTPSGSAVQLVGGDLGTPVSGIHSNRRDLEAPASCVPSSEKGPPGSRGGGGGSGGGGGGGGGRGSFSSLLRGLKMGLPRGGNAAGVNSSADVESAARPSGSGEQAFRIWSLPNEGAIVTDPYTKVGGSVERKESKPPSRPS